MKFFLDTANIDEIRDLADTGFVDGVTTNPSLISKSNRNFFEVLQEICNLIDGPVSAEVAATEFDQILEEGKRLAALADNIVVKVPLTPNGLKACKVLNQGKINVNVTLCFSPAQAILAAKAGALFVSPFVGRLDDVGSDGMQLIADIQDVYSLYPDFTTKVLVASIRHPMHVVEAAKLGADVVTLPPTVLRQMFNHPLTDKGLADFLADWQKTGQSI